MRFFASLRMTNQNIQAASGDIGPMCPAGGAEWDPGEAEHDLLRFAEHPRCAGRSAERERLTRCN